MTHDFAYMRIQAEHDDKAMREKRPAVPRGPTALSAPASP